MLRQYLVNDDVTVRLSGDLDQSVLAFEQFVQEIVVGDLCRRVCAVLGRRRMRERAQSGGDVGGSCGACRARLSGRVGVGGGLMLLFKPQHLELWYGKGK